MPFNVSNCSPYDSFLDSMARVQSVDDKAIFVFVSDATAHHSEWLESTSCFAGLSMLY